MKNQRQHIFLETEQFSSQSGLYEAFLHVLNITVLRLREISDTFTSASVYHEAPCCLRFQFEYVDEPRYSQHFSPYISFGTGEENLFAKSRI